MADSPRTLPPRPPDTVDMPTVAPPVTPPGSRPGSADAIATGSFGDYELLGEIERGGMGAVYKARERHSGRLVALKMMLHETATGPGDLRRFALEARATGELNHPGVVAIHAWGEHEGHPFYTMDFVPGVPLSRLLEKGPLPVARAVGYLLGIARAVGAARGRAFAMTCHRPTIRHRASHPVSCSGLRASGQNSARYLGRSRKL